MNPKPVTIWCALWSERIIEQAEAVNVVLQLESIALDYMQFQQEVVTSHIAYQTLAALHGSFPGYVISQFGNQNSTVRGLNVNKPLVY